MKLVKCIKNKGFKLTIGKQYEVEAELFDLSTMETYAIEIYDDKDNFVEIPVDYVEFLG